MNQEGGNRFDQNKSIRTVPTRYDNQWRNLLRVAGVRGSTTGWRGAIRFAVAAVVLLAFAEGWALSLPWTETTLLSLALAMGVRAWVPVHWRTLAMHRSQSMSAALPDALNFIAISVEAGLTLDTALTHLVPEISEPLRTPLHELL
jgi:Flp pilus assembly protein TadB